MHDTDFERIRPAMNVRIRGPVLLLMGPLGSFFSRFANFLLASGVSTHKVMFPLKEFFPCKKHITLHYNRSMEEWEPHLRSIVARYGIKHLFMYGDFIAPHKIAINLAQQLGLEAWVFELGYLRPDYVTLERDRVNARSNLNKPVAFYNALPARQKLAKPEVTISNRWRKIWRLPYFIQHALTDYRIMDGPHKLQPKPSYLCYELLSALLKPWYALKERRTKAHIRKVPTLFLAALQVSIDSQVTLASSYQDINHFITEVMESFAAHSDKVQHLVFKHHPADRGYNNYMAFIRSEGKRLSIGGRVHYIHDDSLADLLKYCSGVITINSTVGLTALKHNIPTKVMGTTFYDLPGLTAQCSLDKFWGEPSKIDRTLLTKFLNFLIEHTQINGNFWGYFPFEKTFAMEKAVLDRGGPRNPATVGG